jgi:hypothetical protein
LTIFSNRKPTHSRDRHPSVQSYLENGPAHLF